MTSDSNFLRTDNRMAHQIRAITTESSTLNQADGSAKFHFGHTKLLVGVFGPVEVLNKDELIEKATVQVTFHPDSGRAGIHEAEMEEFLQCCADNALISNRHPRTAVRITAQQMEDDGSALAAALNATCLALLDAGLEMNHLVVAATTAIDQGGRILLDPTRLEENDAAAVLTFAFSSALDAIVASHTAGVCSEEQLLQCAELSRKACSKILALLRTVVEKQQHNEDR